MKFDILNLADKFKQIITPKIIKDAVTEPDGVRVSSARVWGGLIIMVLLACNATLVGVLSFDLWKAMHVEPHDVPALVAIVTGIKDLTYLYFIMAATALSLYGINVFKYLGELKNGASNMLDKTLENVSQKASQESDPEDNSKSEPQEKTSDPKDDK